MKRILIIKTLLIFIIIFSIGCDKNDEIIDDNTDNTNEKCTCGNNNPERFRGNNITTEKTTFSTSGYDYQFCSTTDGDLLSGFTYDGNEECSSLLDVNGYTFEVISDPLASYTENSLGANLFVIVTSGENEVLELKHPSDSQWSYENISDNIDARGSIASYWSTNLDYHYVYFIGTDGGLYSTYKDVSTNQWTEPNNLLSLLGLSNNAVEITDAKVVEGTNGDDLYISYITSDNEEIKLVHYSNSVWEEI